MTALVYLATVTRETESIRNETEAAKAAEIAQIRDLRPRHNSNYQPPPPPDPSLVEIFRRCSKCGDHFQPSPSVKKCPGCYPAEEFG